MKPKSPVRKIYEEYLRKLKEIESREPLVKKEYLNGEEISVEDEIKRISDHLKRLDEGRLD